MTGADESINGYPAIVTSPREASALPLDRAAGPASLLYSPQRPADPYYLVRRDGRQYLVSVPYPTEESFAITLSPDGRWLGWTEGNDFCLRDLTGVAVRRIEREHPGYGALWSADSRRLLLTGPLGVYWLADLRTGAVDDVRGLPDDACVGLSGDGAVLQWDYHDLRFQWVDPRAARDDRTITPIHVAPGRRLEYPRFPPLLSPDGRHVIVPLFQARSSFDPYFAQGSAIALALCDLGDGHVIQRFDLSEDCRWRPLAYRPEGVVLLRHEPDRGEIAVLGRSGQPRVVCTMPVGQPMLASVVVPGTTGH
jgi:hypothetical protein